MRGTLIMLLAVASAIALKLPPTAFDVPQLPLWPYPTSVSVSPSMTVLTVDPSLSLQCVGESCSSSESVLASAFSRYVPYILWAGTTGVPKGTLRHVQVNATSVPALALGIDESYTLQISSTGEATINANTEWGALHALETLSQLVLWNVTTNAYYVNYVPITIHDAPRFQWRSLLIDSSRHFLPVPTVLRQLDAMSWNKFNVLHWHLSDDESFPFMSIKFPQLSGGGAYSPRATYNTTDIANVIEYARLRGIRVVPEFDTPGHTGSWMSAWPDDFTPCAGTYSLMNPTTSTLYPRLTQFYTEIAKRFPDEYVHVGGDEVDLLCWLSNSNITAWMKAHNSTNIADVQAYHEMQVTSILNNLGRDSIGWEEAFRNQGTRFALPKNFIVDVWETGVPTLIAAVKAGYRVLWSWGYYLDQQIPNPNREFYLWLDTWMDFYLNDPVAGAGLTPTEEALVLGGGSSQWGEQVDSTCIDERIWPRASGTAERLWSPAYVNNTDDAQARLVLFRCHMVRRGLNASPIRPDWCELGPLGML